MGLHKTLPDEISEVDIVIAGGGTSGCIVASRIASADPKLSVLVVECGPNNYNDPAIIHAGLFFGHLMPDSKTTLFHTSNASKHLDGRAPVVPYGGVLGGGSSINMCMYSRAQHSDFDSWETPGWTASEMLPYLKKFETYHGLGEEALHGYDGPIAVSSGPHRASKSQEDFITAAKAAGWPEVDDLQSMSCVNAVSRAWRYVSPDGIRQDTAHMYLHPRLRDVIENGRATGVVFRPNPKFHPGPIRERTVLARKMVIVSSGALNTPLILERSGIGIGEVLTNAGVPLLLENRGVGVGLQDHQLMTYAYKTGLEKGDTINGLVFGTTTPADLLAGKDKTLGYNAQDVSGKFRPTDEDATALGPDFADAWTKHFKHKPDKPLVGIAMINCMPGFPPDGVPYGEYLGISTFNMYPFSRGHIHITGPSIGDVPDFDTGFLSDPQNLDMKMHIWAYNVQREIMRRMQCYRGEVPEWSPTFSGSSLASPVSLDGPLAGNAGNITYSKNDEAAIEAFVRRKVDTTWHSLGSCKMAPFEKGGVVDNSLNVYGVSSLKIADLSIAPGNVGANTNSTALAIGEKAADIILQELGY